MQIVIDIDEDREFIQKVSVEGLFEEVERENETETLKDRAYARGWNACKDAIIRNIHKVLESSNVVVLPKGHGRLIDADKLISSFPNHNGMSDIAKTIDYAPTVVEADKEMEE